MVWWILIGLVALGLVPFVVIFGSMMFVGQITEFGLRLRPAIKRSSQTLTLTPLGPPESPARRLSHYDEVGGDACVSRFALQNGDGTIAVGDREDGEDERKGVHVLRCPEHGLDLAFVDGTVHRFDGTHLGEVVAALDAAITGELRDIMVVNEHWALVDTFSNRGGGGLWLVGLPDFHLEEQLTADSYYWFVSPPRRFVLADDTIAMVTYSESANYGFGGDSSRPRYSTLRLFVGSSAGVELVRFSLRAGAIVAVADAGDGDLELTTDASRPGQPPRQQQRWRLRRS